MFSSQKLTVLYIEDNPEIRENLTEYLQKNGITVRATDTVSNATAIFKTEKIDIAMVDLQLTNHNGMEFVRYLRDQQIQTPVIVTTAYTEKNFLLDAITYDVTRYLVKPFKKTELIEALQVASKKLVHYKISTSTMLHQGYRYDPENKSVVTPDGESIQLSKKEYLFLELLLSHVNQIVSYEMIETVVWKNSPMSIDALRTLVRGIRKKVYQDLFVNLNGLGYKISL